MANAANKLHKVYNDITKLGQVSYLTKYGINSYNDYTMIRKLQ